MPSLLPLFGAALLLGAATAHAATTDPGRAAAGPGPAAVQAAPCCAPHAPHTRASRRKPRILHLPSPAQESPARRDRRLARECRGRPNAGACLGHALAPPTPRDARALPP